MFRIVHTADLHLDPDYAYLAYNKLEERRLDFLNAFDQIIDFCVKEKPDALLISGDFYDKILPRNDPRVHVIERFKELNLKSPNTKVLVISGNHDTPKSRDEAKTPVDTLKALDNITIFDDKTQFRKVVLEKDGKRVGIYGKSFYGLKGNLNPVENLPDCSEDLGIAMIHGSVKEMNPIYSDYSQYAPFSIKDCIGKDFDYFALGHYHKFQTKAKKHTIFCYPGSTERYTFTEEQYEKGFVWFDLHNDLSTDDLNFQKLDVRRMQTKEIEFNPQVEDINKFVLDNLIDKDPELLLRIVLKGDILFDVYRKYKINELQRELEKSFFALRIENELNIKDVDMDYDFSSLRILTPMQELENFVQNKIKLFKEEHNVEYVRLYEDLLKCGIEELKLLGVEQ
jgi:DNA repair exonuclease SbcCD nuclease subunit